MREFESKKTLCQEESFIDVFRSFCFVILRFHTSSTFTFIIGLTYLNANTSGIKGIAHLFAMVCIRQTNIQRKRDGFTGHKVLVFDGTL